MALIGVMLGVTIAWWSWRLAGHWAAMIATAAFSLDPNFLAHSALVKNDVPVTLALMLFMAALWLIGERATLARCIAVGVLVGVAITIKLSGIAAVPILLIALACRIWIAGDWPILKWMARSRLEKFAGAAAILAAAGLLAYLSIWAVYQFRFAPTPDGQGEFDLNHLLKVRAAGEYIVANHLSWNSSIDPQWMAAWKPDPAIRLIQWMDHRRLFPQSWLFGLLYTDATALVRREFLCGDYRLTGWWYYFPLAIVFKTPLTTLIAVILSLAYGGWQVTRTKARQYGWALCAGAILPLTYLCLAMNSNLDVGFRHVLPIYPFLFILIGVAAIAARRRWPRTITAVGVALLAGLSVETFMAYPNFIPFFNVAAGGERGGLKLLTDSNIDWGQDLPALALWQKEHADRQLYLCYFGTADPRFYGIHYINLPGSEAAPDELTPTGKPIAIAISATELQGTYQTDEQRQRYVALRDRSPAAVLGGSIYIYLPGSGKP